jgi:hypothetical protein
MGFYMCEMLRADLDGNGYEDMLVSFYFHAIGGTLGFGDEPIALARRNLDELFSCAKPVPSSAAQTLD